MQGLPRTTCNSCNLHTVPLPAFPDTFHSYSSPHPSCLLCPSLCGTTQSCNLVSCLGQGSSVQCCCLLQVVKGRRLEFKNQKVVAFSPYSVTGTRCVQSHQVMIICMNHKVLGSAFTTWDILLCQLSTLTLVHSS